MTNRTPPQVSDWLREEAKNLGEYSERSREVMRAAVVTIREQGDLIRKLSQQNNDLRKHLSAVPNEKPFYGAQCPTYPRCNGGCGLGCTHEIEGRK